MQIKSKILIVGAIAALIALALIQWYLIRNSYELQHKTFKMDAFSAIAGFASTKEIKDISEEYQQHLLSQLQKIDTNSSTWKTDLVNQLQKKCEKLNPVFNHLFQERLAKLKIDVDLQIVLENIAFADTTGKIDTAFSKNPANPITLLGSDLNLDNGNRINTREWTQDIGYNNIAQYNKLFLTTKIYMHLDNWKSAIFKELASLYLGVFFILSFVIALVAYSIHNLIKHKNLSEIQSDFINNITHELKTPLTTQKIALKQLSRNETLPLPAQPLIKTLDRQNQRLEKLIDQVVNHSLGYKELQLNKTHVNIGALLQSIIDDFKLTLENEIELNTFIKDQAVVANIDSFHFTTTILNLLTNAVKYEGTKIAIEAQLIKQEYQIIVADNGIGIDKKNHKFVFDKFYRVSEKNQHNYKGLGLGLYYCQQSINAHFGSIELESEIGKGSKFIIHLPIINSVS